MKITLSMLGILSFVSICNASPSYDVISANAGHRDGTFSIAGTPCSMDIHKDPHFNLNTMPYSPTEFDVSYHHPGGYVTVGICSPSFDVNAEEWSLASANVMYRYPDSQLKINADFKFDPATNVISQIYFPDNGDTCILR